ncbi:MAG: hypothetical protein KKE89_06325, partial [Actinobacteria bacterium]|nr:hypothetical protein [Actinomycetota bacterium]
MQTQHIDPFAHTDPRGLVEIVDGYSIRVRVVRRHLVIEDGYGPNRRTRRHHRATTKLKRLVLVGHTGYITLEATRWLTDVGVELIHLDPDGKGAHHHHPIGSPQRPATACP